MYPVGNPLIFPSVTGLQNKEKPSKLTTQSEMDRSLQTKLFNDPVHGFISVPKGILLQLIDHPAVQRLRRIRQLGFGYLVYPAAEHSRFSHALGAMELGQRVLQHLLLRDTTISQKELEGTLIAILLHDIGHGPFSHALEHTLIQDFDHEMMSLAIMERLNKEFNGGLTTAIQIFRNQYSKSFLHQLISSQLDIDRLDYLKRDSFFTGVSEGSVGINRILKTMRVHKGSIVIEKKGIYAVENYILSRRFMYMQVYLHKTVLSADILLRQIMRRVRDLIQRDAAPLLPSISLGYFLTDYPSASKQLTEEIIDHYMLLDDHDVLQSVKAWSQEKDPILRDLSQRFLNRTLPRTTFLKRKLKPQQKEELADKTFKLLKKQGVIQQKEDAKYYLSFNQSFSEAYRYEHEGIWILEDNQTAIEFSKASDSKHIMALTKPVIRPYCVHLKGVEIKE